MSGQRKTAEEYWLSKLHHPFSAVPLPWGAGKGSESLEVVHSQALPAEASQALQLLGNHNQDAIQLLFLGVLKVLLHGYTREKNITVSVFNPSGARLSTEAIEPGVPLKDLMKRLLEEYREGRSFAEMSPGVLAEKYRVRTGHPVEEAMFQFAMVYEAAPREEELLPYGFICRVVPTGPGFTVEARYRTGHATARKFLALLVANYVSLLGNLRQALNQKISRVDIRSAAEREAAPEGASAVCQAPRVLHGLFEEQARLHPHRVAARYEEASLTYGELNRRANQLAAVLAGKGVTAGSIVGLLFNRSLEMLVGILGVLKAGGAYMPIDPAYPEERRAYMLKDSGAALLLTDNPEAPGQGPEVLLYGPALVRGAAGDDPGRAADPRVPAYVLYTSGTTGQPKGVVISHADVSNLLLTQRQLPFDHTRTWSFFHSFCFDVSVWEMYCALLFGGRLIIHPAATVRDPEKLLAVLVREKVNMLCQTPTAFYNLMPYALPPHAGSLRLDCIIFAGEALNLPKLKAFQAQYPRTRLINMYGITETTIYSTFKEITGADLDSGISNIGAGLPNTQLLILDDDMQEVAAGVTGEIYLGGSSISRGYLNKPELTSRRFVNQPGQPVPRVLYRSGDLARRLPNGEVEYLGRKDNQVKIHGFRVELEEVEAHILQSGKVQDVVAVVREHRGVPSLCAYFAAPAVVAVAELRQHLARRMPHYMIPAYFQQLPRLPVTVNGKKDKSRLPAIEVNTAATACAPPQTDAEKCLAQVWKNLFGVETVNVHDAFYDLGGDSIRAIQLKAGLVGSGFTVEIADILQGNSLRAIAAKMQQLQAAVAQHPVTGAVGLNPVQRKFLESNGAVANHFNQSLLIALGEPLREADLVDIFGRLMHHHDALRLRVAGRESAGAEAFIEGQVPVSLVHYDLSGHENAGPLVHERMVALQRSIDLAAPPLVKLALFTTREGQQLLISVHHFAIDGVSWRILLEDFSALYAQRRSNLPFRLPLKTQSVKAWNEALREAAAGKQTGRERAYWESICQPRRAVLPGDRGTAVHYAGNFAHVSFRLDSRTGQFLAAGANRAYHTKTEDLLLAALYRALEKQYGMEAVLFNLEGHGRNAGPAEADVSRTVGWFTVIFPFRAVVPPGSGVRETIIGIKEQLRAVPGGGGGYGLLRYLAPAPAGPSEKLSYRADVEFNYLGQFDNASPDSPFSVLSYAAGELRDPQFRHDAPLLVNAFLDQTRALQVEISFNTHLIPEGEADALAARLRESLAEVAAHCEAQAVPEHTPADYTYKGLSPTQLAALSARYDFTDVYPLTPVQEGILFHSLVSDDTRVYFEQVSYAYGGALDLPRLYQSLDELSERHELLRSVYACEGTDRPLQLVLRRGTIGRRFEDIRALPPAEQETFIAREQEAEKDAGFVLTDGPLMRLTLLRTADNAYQFVWSFHHLIMDGWCLDVLNRELFALYETPAPDLLPAPSYGDFIRWLGRKDQEAARDHWKNYLEGYAYGAGIPAYKGRQAHPKRMDARSETLGNSQLEALRSLAARHQLTVNSLVQVAWGLLLSRYNNTGDVVYGLVVSGRPAHLPGIDRMIGMFINTIPLRIRFGDTTDVIALARALQRVLVEGADHHHYPLAQLQKDLNQRGGLFDHVLNYVNYPLADRISLFRGGSSTGAGPVSGVKTFEQTHYNFAVSIAESEGLTLKFDYDENVCHPVLMAQLLAGFRHTLGQIADGETDARRIDVLTPGQRRQVLLEFNPPVEEVERKGLHELFEEQVARTPDGTALVDRDHTITYRELDRQADRLARRLAQCGAKPGTVVALLTDRSADGITGLLGILKAGCVYLPVDPEYPAGRIGYMLNDAAAGLVVTNRATAARLAEQDARFAGASPAAGLQVMVLNEPGDRSTLPPAPEDSGAPAARCAYIIYTSGSTGQPKGVLISHQSAVNFIAGLRNRFRVRPDDTVPQFYSPCFDPSVEEIFTTLCNGAKLVLTGRETYLDARTLHDFLNRHKVTFIHASPSFVAPLMQAGVKYLNRVSTGGDVCPPEVAETWHRTVTFFNSYGPTEATVAATQWQVTGSPEYTYSIPIGRPLPNVQVYILDAAMRPLPPGCQGEIYIGGAGVAAGYINRPALSREKFIGNPFREGEKMYRTGDLGRWLPDGTIEFRGRADRQVKVRGRRLELAEVEHHISQFAPFRSVVVLAHAKAAGENSLVAYVQSDGPVDRPGLRQYLAGKLPDYMVPGRYVEVSAMPLTSNGKVDVAALAALAERPADATAAAVLPDSPTQQVLADIWKNTLNLRTVGVYDNFFDLGGTSIDLIVVSGKLRQCFNRDDLLLKMFHHTTISALAAYIDQAGQEEPGDADGEEDDLALAATRSRQKDRRKRRREQRN